MHQALCLTLNMNDLLGSSKQPWHKSPMTATSQMGYWGWEWMCGGAQGCHVTAHSQAVSGPDGEHWRKTIILHKSCYLVREHNLSKSLQPSEADIVIPFYKWGTWGCRRGSQLGQFWIQPTGETKTIARTPPSKGLWDTRKMLNKWDHLLNAICQLLL